MSKRLRGQRRRLPTDTRRGDGRPARTHHLDQEWLDHFLAVGEGLVEIRGDRVNILTDMAVEAERIDEAMVEEARQRAAARLQEKLTAEEVASVNAALARSLAQLRVKRRQVR